MSFNRNELPAAKEVASNSGIAGDVKTQPGSRGEIRLREINHATCPKHERRFGDVTYDKMSAKGSLLSDQPFAGYLGQGESSAREHAGLAHVCSDNDAELTFL